VGGIVDSLKEYRIEKNTLIFVIGDNGAPVKIHKEDLPGIGPGWDGSLNDPLNGEKGMLSEGGIRVPFVVHWKGTIPGGKAYSHPVMSLDVGATAIALAGLAEDPLLDGVNIVPHLTGEKKGPPHDVLTWRWGNQGAIRKGQWKYLHCGSHEYLYNMKTDREEKHNVIAANRKIAAGLKAMLVKWAAGLNPPGLDTDDSFPAAKRFFDYYHDGKPAGPLGPARARKTPRKSAPFEKLDRNGDGKMTLKEMIGDPEKRNVPALTKRFKNLDKNGDKFITPSEYGGGK
jgi:uncharacterized sulfatase